MVLVLNFILCIVIIMEEGSTGEEGGFTSATTSATTGGMYLWASGLRKYVNYLIVRINNGRRRVYDAGRNNNRRRARSRSSLEIMYSYYHPSLNKNAILPYKYLIGQ